jgi:hypothetical protein
MKKPAATSEIDREIAAAERTVANLTDTLARVGHSDAIAGRLQHEEGRLRDVKARRAETEAGRATAPDAKDDRELPDAAVRVSGEGSGEGALAVARSLRGKPADPDAGAGRHRYCPLLPNHWGIQPLDPRGTWKSELRGRAASISEYPRGRANARWALGAHDAGLASRGPHSRHSRQSRRARRDGANGDVRLSEKQPSRDGHTAMGTHPCCRFVSG